MLTQQSRIRATCRRAVGGIAMLLLAVAMILLVGEVSMPFWLMKLPLRTHGFIPELYRPLAMPTKSGLWPRDPVLLLGDSNALGLGDGMRDSFAGGTPYFGAATELHRMTGKDVLSLGTPGAGIPRGWIIEPEIFYHGHPSFAGKLAAPSVVLLFFYEGNDVDDTIRELGLLLGTNATALCSTQEGAQRAAQATANAALKRLPDLPAHSVVLSIIKDYVRGEQEVDWPSSDKWKEYPNFARIGADVVQLAGHLQAPDLPADTNVERTMVAYLEAAIAHNRLMFPGARIAVVYVPAVANCYRLASSMLSVESRGPLADRIAAQDIGKMSDSLFNDVRDACAYSGTALIDCRRTMQKAGSSAVLHGPKDWYHFNRKGYETLARAIADALAVPPPEESETESRPD